MKRRIALAILLGLGVCYAGVPPSHAREKWIRLFDGKTLNGWRANHSPESFAVVDGAIRARAVGTSAHLFYVGDKKEGFVPFKNFELVATVRGESGANSGIFFHTDFTERNTQKYLANGYEVQLNSSEKEKVKTGSLYAVADIHKSPVDETKWFKVNVRVVDKRIVVRVNGKTVVDYTEPDPLVRPPDRIGRRIRPEGGAIALQAHDPESTFYFKEIRIRPLP
ncbi:MAG: DUF1080 domain-containing protein [Armatimonadetes bacterium]|nr:DUF1080 domain-containing protein [Armatimonadota bacterium]